jgi:hypothetical protein
MKKFTLYRPTSKFFNTLNSNKENLNLHRERTFVRDDLTPSVNAIIAMLKAGHLVPAATCIASNHEDMFRLTNSIDCAWTDNKEVSVLNNDAFLSSTSVGDIFKDDESGQFYIVAGCSMEKISLPKDIAI